MPKILSVVAMLVAVFVVALGGALAGNSLAGSLPGQTAVPAAPSGTGSDGLDSAAGHDGADGAAGAPGQTGPEGPIGMPGKEGLRGQDGAPGKVGATGERGAPGPTGADGRDGVDGNVNVRLVQNKSDLSNAAPSVTLQFSPRLSNETWLVETHWTPAGSASGSCSVSVGGSVVSSTSGERALVDLSADSNIQLWCKSDSHTNAFLVVDSWMLATRVTG